MTRMMSSGVHDREAKMWRALRDAITTGTLTLVGAVNCLTWLGGLWWIVVFIMAGMTMLNLALAATCYYSKDLGPMP